MSIGRIPVISKLRSGDVDAVSYTHLSPLISLMKDQVAALTEAGVPAAFLNSSLSLEQLRETYAKTAKEQYKLLYVAPERCV